MSLNRNEHNTRLGINRLTKMLWLESLTLYFPRSNRSGFTNLAFTAKSQNIPANNEDRLGPPPRLLAWRTGWTRMTCAGLEASSGKSMIAGQGTKIPGAFLFFCALFWYPELWVDKCHPILWTYLDPLNQQTVQGTSFGPEFHIFASEFPGYSAI